MSAAAPYARAFPTSATTFAILAAARPSSPAILASEAKSGPVRVSVGRPSESVLPGGDSRLTVRVEINDGVLMYHLYGRQFPLDDRRIVVIEDLAKSGAFGETGRMWVLGQTGWREWPPAALGTDERDLVARVVDSIRVQMLHTLDYRHALANPSSADERRRGRDVSRTIARDQPLTRDLAQNLLETADRLVAEEKELTAAATPPSAPPAPSPLPARGAP